MFSPPGSGVLPATSSEFVGRQAQRRRIATLIEHGARLITVVGPGGIGKTRLAIEALRRDIGAPTHRLCFSDLDAPGAVAGTRASATRSGAEPKILLLDTCDRVLDTLAPVLAEALDGDPALTVVATAREPIGWIDESLVPVPPLEPEDALRLLRIRMAFAGRRGDATGDEGTLAQICRHLDHNPLYLRLAAARLRHHPPATVLAEVCGDAYDRRLRWTDGARVGVELRHRDIGASIAWSAVHCDGTEMLLLQRLSVFPPNFTGDGGVGYDVIVEVCADQELPAASIGPLLDRLVERSLVGVRLDGASARWSLTECVRVYARAQLHRRDRYDVNRLAARYRRMRLRQRPEGELREPHRHRCPACTGSVAPAARTAPDPGHWDILSRAEREVARLAAAGWSNSAIAAGRRCSVRTVDAQLATVRQKLRIGSRSEIAGYLPATSHDVRRPGPVAR